MRKIVTGLFSIGIVLAGCSSGDEEPEGDLDLLSFLGVGFTENYSWSGTATRTVCGDGNTIPSAEAVGRCETHRIAEETLIKDIPANLSISLIGMAQSIGGNFSMLIPHYNDPKMHDVRVDLNGHIEPGYDSGSGITRLFRLSSVQSTTGSGNVIFRPGQITATEDGNRLTGDFTIVIEDQSGQDAIMVGYSFSLEKEL